MGVWLVLDAGDGCCVEGWLRLVAFEIFARPDKDDHPLVTCQKCSRT